MKMINIYQNLEKLINHFETLTPQILVDYVLNQTNQYLINPLDENTIKRIKRIIKVYSICLHHCLKHENRTHKIPSKYKPRERSLLKKDGYFIYRLLELCLNCFYKQNFDEDDYFDSPVQWFNFILVEMLSYDILNILNPEKRYELENGEKKEFKVKNGDRKREKLKDINSHLSQLESLEIPFVSGKSLPIKTTAYTKLIEVIVSICNLEEKPFEFRKNYYIPYIQAHRDIVRDIAQSDKWQLPFRLPDDPKVYRQGKGRSKTVVGEVMELVSINT